MSIQGQLTENGQRLDKLRSDLRRYQAWLEEAEGGGGPGSPASTLSSRTNGEDEVESLSRSASDSSVNHHKNTPGLTSLTSQGSSTSPESGLGNSHLSLGPGGTEGEHFQDIDDGDDEEFFEPEPLPVLAEAQVQRILHHLHHQYLESV